MTVQIPATRSLSMIGIYEFRILEYFFFLRLLCDYPFAK